MKVIKDFKEYQILAMSNGYKVEDWNGVILKRPDPQIILEDKIRDNVDATYERSSKGGGSWSINNKKLKDVWQIHYDDLTFNLKLMGFKHTGLFPEQAYNWKMLKYKIEQEINDKEKKIQDIEKEMMKEEIASDYIKLNELQEDIQKINLEIEDKMQEWENLNNKL